MTNRGYNIVLVVDVDMTGKDDDTDHLPYATHQRLVMVTFDRPFAGRTTSQSDHGGLICISENLRYNIGGMIRILAAFAEAYSVDDTQGQVFWLK